MRYIFRVLIFFFIIFQAFWRILSAIGKLAKLSAIQGICEKGNVYGYPLGLQSILLTPVISNSKLIRK